MLLYRYVRASVAGQAQYPGSTLLLTFGQFLGTGLELVAMWALFDRFGRVAGWRLGEVALFYGLVNVQFTIADLATRGFDVLGSELIRTGAFDRVLLRPRSLTLQLVGHAVRLSRLGRLVQALIVLGVSTARTPLDWSISKLAVALWATAGGAALFSAIFILQGTLSIFTVESLEVMNVLTYGGVQAAQYPLALYGRWLRWMLTFIVPLACVTYYPALAILGKADPLGAPPWTGVVTPVFGFAFLGLALIAWRSGVRHYTSTGS